MKYNIKLLQEILSKASQHNETIDLMEYSYPGGLKLEYKDKTVGFPIVTAVEVPHSED
jgi:hypothetical protein